MPSKFLIASIILIPILAIGLISFNYNWLAILLLLSLPLIYFFKISSTFKNQLFGFNDLKDGTINQQLAETKKRLEIIVETISDSTVVWMSTPGVETMLFVNQGYEKIWGKTRESLYTNPRGFIESVIDEDKERVLDHLSKHQKGNWNIGYRINSPTGIKHIKDVGHGIHSESGQLLYLVGTAQDITEQRNNEIQLEETVLELKQAYETLKVTASKDSLTKVLNRRTILKQGEHEIEKFKRHKTPFTILFIDLDNFKELNDKYGHVVGDKVLQEVASHIQAHIRDIDYIGRYGGDEFLVILPNTNLHSSQLIAKRLHKDSIKLRPFGKDNMENLITITVTAGTVEYLDENMPIEELIRLADQNMYRHKNLKK